MKAQNAQLEITELHWMMDMVQSIDVGLVVLDRKYNVQVWNGFMADHSGVPAHKIIGQNIFKIFPDISIDWFTRKAESVFMLNCRSFSTWEQRPYFIKFKNNRPITGPADYMYQNITLIPLTSINGRVNQVGIIVYDVTDSATNSSELAKANSKLQGLSRTDHLTQLYNRGYWEQRLKEEYLRSLRTNQPCSLIMFDIDFFKDVNDQYGHQAGDEVIRYTADQIREKIRATDIAGRYGGEEFGIILIDTTAESAYFMAERIRKGIESIELEFEDFNISYTISIGVAEIHSLMEDYHEWVEAADRALYKAKKSGRNKVVISNKNI